MFIEVPGDEDEIGGCLGAGKGFIHISAEGDVEPCPFAPYSDMNLRNDILHGKKLDYADKDLSTKLILTLLELNFSK